MTTETITREEVIAQPPNIIQDNEKAPTHLERTIIEGRPGVVTITEEVTYTDGVETGRVELSRETTIQAQASVIEKGTFNLSDHSVPANFFNSLSPSVGSIVPITQTVELPLHPNTMVRRSNWNEDTVYLSVEGSRVPAKFDELVYSNSIIKLTPKNDLIPGTVYKMNITAIETMTPGGYVPHPDIHYYFMTEGPYNWTPLTTEWIAETEYEDIPFTTETTYDDTLEEGQVVEEQAGVNGQYKIVIEYEYLEGVKTGDTREISRVTEIEMIPKIVRIGAYVGPPRDPKLADMSLKVYTRGESTIRVYGYPETYDVGDTVPLFTNDILIIQANPGYVITEQSHISERWIGGRDGFYMSADRQTAILEIVRNKVDYDYNMLYVYTTPKVTGHANYNNLYLVDTDALKELNTHRFIVQANGLMLADYGQYIINLLELPMPINEDILLPDSTINLGNLSIPNTRVPVLDNDKMYLDIGDIEIPNKYNNLLDFNQTTVTIHLPFTHSIQIENKYAIGQTVSIEYVIDLYTGETTANFRTTKLDNKLFHSEPIILGKTVPMATAGSPSMIASVRGNLIAVKAGIHNGIYTAYAEVSRHIPDQPDNIYNVNIVSNTTLANETGYLIVSNIKLQTDATYAERDMIVAQLAGGIHIN